MKKLLALMVAAFFGCPLFATTWYVNGTNGSDSYSGTSSSQAKKTIQAAIDASNSGDTILVGPGTYSPFISNNKLISILSQMGAEKTIVEGDGTAVCANCVNERYQDGEDWIGTNTFVCGFTLCGGSAGTFAGTFDRCIVTRNEGSGVDHSVVRNCLVCGNRGGNGGGCIGSFAVNCTIFGNEASMSGDNTYCCVLQNCIVYDGDIFNFSSSSYASGEPLLARTLGYANYATEDCYINDPKFVDAANGDYHLAAGSPCIDVGDNSYVTREKDLDGKARIVNGRVDIGCYEYGTSRTWYVNGTSGSDSYSGTSSSQAKKTIQAAIDVAANGDTILVAAGMYAPIDTKDKSLTISGLDDAKKTIIDGFASQQCAVLGGRAWAEEQGYEKEQFSTLVGFTLRNGTDGAYWSSSEGAAVRGGVIKRCVITDCNALGAVVYASEAHDCLVVKNDAGSAMAVMMHGRAYNCTIVNNEGDAAWDNGLLNSVLSDNSGDVYISYGNGFAYPTNCVLQSSLSVGFGNKVADPKFVDVSNGDYHLASDSPCIDAGDNSYVMSETDLDGNVRIVGGKVDVGCYEYWADAIGKFWVTQYSFEDSPWSIDEALSKIDDPSSWSAQPISRAYPVIAFSDSDGHAEDFNFERFPGNPNGKSPDGFAVVSRGKIYVRESGTYTFCCGSDDGFRCVISTDENRYTFEYAGERNYGRTFKTISFSKAGVCDLDLTHFSYGGGVLFLSVAKGTHSSFDSSAFKLVGDPASGITLVGSEVPTTCTVVFSANGGTCSTSTKQYVNGSVLSTLPTAARVGYEFLGWFTAAVGGTQVTATTVVTEDVTFYAHWTPSVILDDEEPMDAGVANTYDGIIMDADGLPVGYISIKAAKASGKGEIRTSKVKATIQMAGEAKKVTVKGNVTVSEATFVQSAPDGRVLDLMFTRNSIFGMFDGYEIEGVRNILASTAKGDKGSEAKQRAEAIYNRLKGNYVMAYGDEAGWNGLSLSIMAKGKVKVSGALADGTKVSTSTQMIVGEDYSCIPVIYTKKDVSLSFSIYFSNEGEESFVFGYYDAVISRVAALGGERLFCLYGNLYDLFDDAGCELLEDFLPWEVAVAPKGTKWIIADGAMAGQIKMDKDGEVYDAKESENPSGLKLTFTPKTGLFKGSFKVYAIDAKGKLKRFSASVNGIVVNGIGYGTATIKKMGSVSVMIE